MAVLAEREETIDYDETAALVTAAFASPNLVFQPDHLRWTYERSFSLGSIIIALRDGPHKVGQLSLVRQIIMIDGKPELGAQLVDLFIMPGYRGRDSLQTLFDEAGRQFEAQGIRFAIGMANARAVGINSHFFAMTPLLRMPLHLGLARTWTKSASAITLPFSTETREKCLAFFEHFETPPEENGVRWTAESLAERLGCEDRRYAIHALDNLLLISSPRCSRGVSHTLLCGFFVHGGSSATKADVRELVRTACTHWGQPLFAYAGINSRLPMLPGVPMPGKVRPSPLLLQLRDFQPDQASLRFDRFQVLDFDLG